MAYRDPPPAAPPPAVIPQTALRAPKSRYDTLGIRYLLMSSMLIPVFGSFFFGSLSWIALPWIVVVGLLLARPNLRLMRASKELAESQALIQAGNYPAAGEVCERVLTRYRGIGFAEATALTVLSTVVYRRGEPGEALALLEGIERSGWCTPGSVLEQRVRLGRALFLTALGRLDEAERGLVALRGQISAAQATAQLVPIEAMLAAKRGRFADVAALTGTPEAQPLLQHKMVRLLRAWALVETGGDASADQVRVLIDGARPLAPGELRYLAGRWPELSAFLVARGLGDAT